MKGAMFFEAQMEGADLWNAQMEEANLSGARMNGANLTGANLRSALWAGAQVVASPAQDADLRGGRGLSQAQLNEMTGNAETLLPTSSPAFTIPSCWEALPQSVEAGIRRRHEWRWGYRTEDEIRAELICPESQDPLPTGTPCALKLTRDECLDPKANPYHRAAIGPIPG